MSSPTELIVKSRNLSVPALNYQPPKTNARGGKSVQIRHQSHPLIIAIPMMFTWGVNERVDEASGRVSYDMSLVFENDKSQAIRSFCEKLQQMQDKILDDAVLNSRTWFGKSKLSREVAEAMMYPILKYPKKKDGSGDIDYERDPTLKVKVPYWEGKFNIELFDTKGVPIFNPKPRDGGPGPQGDKTPLDLVPSKSHVKGLISCTGVWMAGGRFGVTWKLVQAQVRKPVRLLGTGTCHLEADSEDDELLEAETKEEVPQMNDALLSEDDEEEEEVVEEKPKPKKKKVVRRKKTKKSDA